MAEEKITRWEFEAREQDDGSFLVTVPAHLHTVARVTEAKPGVWSTELFAGGFFERVGGPATSFVDQPSADDAFKAIADWGNNHIAVFTNDAEADGTPGEPRVF